jgi:positive regulator of sigma E activity
MAVTECAARPRQAGQTAATATGDRVSSSQLLSAGRHVLRGLNETSCIPSALLDYQRGHYLVQFATGARLGSRDAFLQLANGSSCRPRNTTGYT